MSQKNIYKGANPSGYAGGIGNGKSGKTRGKGKVAFGVLLGAMLIFCAMFMTACTRERLAAPTIVGVDDALRLTWSEVENSTGGYTVEVNGIPYHAEKTMYPLAERELPAGIHIIRVKANTIDANYFLDSEWSEPFEYPIGTSDVGLSYKLISNGTEYAVSGRGGVLVGEIEIKDDYLGKPVTSIGESAFYGATSLTSIKLGKNIKSIDRDAFFNCTGLTSITLPEGLEIIKEGAFINCKQLESITLPTTLMAIEPRAFAYCYKLGEITIPDSVIYLGARAFSDCTGLKKVVLGDGITVLLEGTFYGCRTLTDVTLGNNLEHIVMRSFAECTQLADITIPSSVNKIELNSFAATAIFGNANDVGLVYAGNWLLGYDVDAVEGQVNVVVDEDTVGIANYAFNLHPNMETVSLPDSLEKMGTGVFIGCEVLSEITIPDSVELISDSTFESCEKLTSVTLKEGLTRIGNRAFANCTRLTSSGINLPTTLTSIGEYAFIGTSIYNNEAETNNVVYLDKWFLGYIPVAPGDPDDRTIINVETSTVGIADYAFKWFISVTEVTVNNFNLKYIGEGAFAYCKGLTKPPLPATLTEIRPNTFIGCDSLVTVNNITTNVKSIGESAFANCAGLTTVTLPDSITEIPDSMFINCGRLLGVDIPASVTKIGNQAFAYCTFLATVNIPEGVKSIGEDAFMYCTLLSNVRLPSTVIEIGEGAFRDCSGLRTINIPSGITEIQDKTFMGCAALSSIYIPESVTMIGSHAFRDCATLTDIEIPDTVTSLGNYAFYGCSGLETLYIGSGISGIGVGAFENCIALESVFIPDNVISIGDYAFRGCRLLTTIIISDKIIGMGTHVFRGCDNITIYSEALGASEWDQYWNRDARPVIWGCVLSEDRTYVESFLNKSDSIFNPNEYEINVPYHKLYSFLGWSDKADGTGRDYGTDIFGKTDLYDKILYAIWY